MSLLHVYTNNPTASATDGTQVSEEHALTSPISGTLTVTADTGADVAVKCAVRCDSGYQTTGDTVLSFYTYDSTAKTYSAYTGSNYKIAADNNYADATTALSSATWGTTLTISDVIGATNKVFWVKMSAAAGATPVKDTSVAIHHTEITEATA